MISSLLLVSLSALINAAQAISYTDHSGLPFTGIHDHTVGFTLGFIFPPSLNGTEFIGEIMASNTQRWAGIALGGAMTESPLIMTWPKGKKGKFSTRYATEYGYPTYDSSLKITTLKPYSKTNATHWCWVFRCQNCAVWNTGSLKQVGALSQAGAGLIGYVTSTIPVHNLADANSTFSMHTYNAVAALDLSGAHHADYHKFLEDGLK